jgi:hypothetical protein
MTTYVHWGVSLQSGFRKSGKLAYSTDLQRGHSTPGNIEMTSHCISSSNHNVQYVYISTKYEIWSTTIILTKSVSSEASGKKLLNQNERKNFLAFINTRSNDQHDNARKRIPSLWFRCHSNRNN